MAAPALVRRALRASAWLGGLLAAGLVLALVSAWIGSSIPRNPDWREPPPGAPGVVEIMVGDNGVHTEIVMPLMTPVKDWRGTFPVADIPASGRPYTHVAVSWGEREVFLNTPTWADLRLSTALGAMIGGDALLHVARYVRPAPGPDNRPLRLTAAQYARLVARIEAAVAPPDRRIKHRGYADWDVFYDAPGRYRWNNTCNQWTSDTLAAAGVRIGWWTPLAGGVMKWIPPPRPEPGQASGSAFKGSIRTARQASTGPPSGRSGRAVNVRRRFARAAAERNSESQVARPSTRSGRPPLPIDNRLSL